MQIRTRLVFLLVFLYQVDRFGPSNGAVDDLPWKNADKLIKAVCPNSNVCELNNGDGLYGNACCEECTCQEDNDRLEQCFIPNDGKESCMKPNTKHSSKFAESSIKEFRDAFLIVTEGPTGGCKGVDIPEPCNPDNILALAPVSSVETNKTYFNKECAACHGIKTFSSWDSVMICDDFDKNAAINFDQELQKFLENPTTSLCFIQFSPNNLTPAKKCKLTQGQEIGVSSIEVANDNETEGSLFGMSIKDIAEACMSDFYNPVFDNFDKKWFPNPFCYIYSVKSEKEAKCYQTSAPGSSEYMALLNPKALVNLADLKGKKKRREVCLPETPDEYKQKGPCREVSCPLGHVFGEDMTCTFIGRRVLFQGYSKFSVRILIKREGEWALNGTSLIKMDVADITKEMEIPQDWRLIFIGHPTDVFGSKRKERDWLMVGYSLGAFEKGLEFMKNRLDQSFRLNDGLLMQTYHKAIYPLALNLTSMRRLDKASKYGGMRCPKTQNHTTIMPQTTDNVLSTCWKIFTYDLVAMDSMVVSKLYHCNLVQLMPDEFEIQANGSLLYNKITKLHLYEKEFVVFENGDGEVVAKVCEEDSGLEPKPRKKSAGLDVNGFRSVLIICVALIIGKLVSFA